MAILLGLVMGSLCAIPTIVLIAVVMTQRQAALADYQPPTVLIYQPPIEVETIDAPEVKLLAVRR